MNSYDDETERAERLLAEALELIGSSWQDVNDVYYANRLKGDLDAKNAVLEVAPWQLGGGDDPRARGAEIFLEAGKHFAAALGKSLAPIVDPDALMGRAIDSFHKARVAFATAMRVAGWAGTDSLRDLEIRAAHHLAVLHLMWAETTRKPDENRNAALYFELESRLAAKYGRNESALDAFRAAAHYFERSDDLAAAGRVAGDEAAFAQEICVQKRRVEALEMQAHYLEGAAQAAKPEDKSYYVVGAALALFEAGMTMAEDENRKEQAAGLIRNGADLMVGRGPVLAIAVVDERLVNADAIVFNAMRKAEELYDEIGAVGKADDMHYLRRRFMRRFTPAWHPVFWLSLLLDLTTGYGTRPLRLLASCAIVVVGFAAIYVVASGAIGAASLAHAGSIAAAAGDGMVLSVRGLVSLLLLKKYDPFGIGGEVQVGGFLAYAVFCESVLGLALSAMALFMLGRWFRRNFVPRH
ncbi:MAG TPA: hypothetical protein VGH49_08430 [Xanthobacteraceae bacterium]